MEFIIDPGTEINPAINALLENNQFFADQGLFAIDLSEAAAVSATKENRLDLPGWLSFDEETLSFDGAPPVTYVGAVPVRLDIVGDGGALPDLSIITDLEVDAAYTIIPNEEDPDRDEYSVIFGPEQINVFRPEDFNGALAVSYQTTDEKGAVSTDPGVIIINILPLPEIPDAEEDTLEAIEDETLTFAFADLLANDRDDDGDPFRAISFDQPSHGTLSVQTATVELDAPSSLPSLAGGIYSATLADGSNLPSWVAINSLSGRLTAIPPLEFKQLLEIQFSVADGSTTASAIVGQEFDGNASATLIYQPDPSYSGEDGFTYTITDDLQGEAQGSVIINVAPVNDPPVTVTDLIDGFEDSVLIIDPALIC